MLGISDVGTCAEIVLAYFARPIVGNGMLISPGGSKSLEK